MLLNRVHEAVDYLKSVSERYAPNPGSQFQQFLKIRQEVAELHAEMCRESDAEKRAKECADVIIAAVRLGTMLSPDFAKVILDKCKELDEREPLS